LGEFSPVGVKIKEVAKTLVHGKMYIRINFHKNGLGYKLGVLFHKRIWSPCVVQSEDASMASPS
jgi:hypothetical protein